MRTILALALVACALGLPGAAHAAELTFAIDASGEYDSNVFRSSEDEKQDGVFRLRPWAQLGDQRGQDLGYRLLYALPVEFAVEHSEVNDVDQELYGDVTYHVNDRLDVFATNSFRYLRNELRTNLDGTESAGVSPFVNEERDRVTMNTASVGANYQFTPRLVGSAQVSHDFFDPSRDDRQEYWQIQGTGSALYVVTPKLRLGGGSSIAYQKFYESQDILGSNAQIYNVFGSARYVFDEKTEISASVGPALIRTKQDDADATKVRGLVPFFRLDRDFTAPVGFVDIFGADVSGDPYPGGAVLLSRPTDCPQLRNGQPVLVSDQSCNPSVVLDPQQPADAAIIDLIEDASATVVNRDPDGEEDTEVTVFADVTLVRHWTPNLHTGLRYAREQGGASGLGGTVVGDSVTLSNTWNITEKWQLAARGEWGLRKSVGEAGQTNTLVFPVDSTVLPGLPAGATPLAGLCCDPLGGGTTGTSFVQRDETTNIDTMRWGFASRVTRLFTRNTSGYLQFTYNRQESQSDSLGDPSDFDDYLVTLGVQHIFNPIKLW